jgi:hypothetical protein
VARPRRHLTIRLLALTALLLGPTECDECFESNAFFRSRVARSDARGGYSDSNRYFSVTAKKRGSGGAGASTPFLLRPPYEISVRFGIFDDAFLPTADGSRGCLNLQSEDFVTIFYAVCAEYQSSPEGMRVDTGPATTELFFAGERRADIRAVADGATLRLYGRPPGGGAWTELGSGWALPPFQGLRIGGAASFVPESSQVGFDELAFAAELPGTPSAEESAAAPVLDALSAGLEAILLLDGDSPDFSNAAGKLELVLGSLESAQTAALALGTQDGKKAAKKLKGAAKKLGKARARAAEQKAEAALKLAYKTPKALIQALDALLGS